MNGFTELILIAEALLKLTLITMIGLYFIFSNTVIKSLKKMANGADVMIEINKDILNPVFLFFFFVSGLSAFYFMLTTTGVTQWASLIFFVGTTLVTTLRNVPLNNALLNAKASPDKCEQWRSYADKWLFWNHIRSISALISGFLLMI